MFTGIIEELGTVGAIARGAHSSRLQIYATKVLEGTRVGDSIAVNGVCLTVTSLGDAAFSADVMHETLDRSSLGMLAVGDKVNLERAMRADGRFGGHIVSGHIDCTGKILSMVQDDNAVRITVSLPPTARGLVIEKGSISIDGISLTVTHVDEGSFEVSVIPHTQSVTTLLSKTVGSMVNLEFDVLGKYVASLLNAPASCPAEHYEQEITMDYLIKHGF